MPLITNIMKGINKSSDNIVMVVLRNGEYLIGKVVHENRYYLHLKVDNHYIPIYKKTIRKVYK